MKIEILCRDGSPLGVSEKSIFGEDGRMGVGGAELALLTLCKGWHDKGYEVILYNDPKVLDGSCFEQRPVSAYNPQDNRDVVINFRSPSPDKITPSKGLKLWFSCDQFTIDDYRAFAPSVEKIVGISPMHKDYFKSNYGIDNMTVIDLPVRTWEYETDVQKVSKRCIFTSMPDRGLMELATLWKRIILEVPDASLVITSDWRLWVEWAHPGMTEQYRNAFAGVPNVHYHGAINRRGLIQIQQEAELHLYSCVYEELFCISVAESQVAGAFPITSGFGALKTTNMGTLIDGAPNEPRFADAFVAKTVDLLQDEERKGFSQLCVQQKAKERFSLDCVLDQWDKVFND